MFWIIVPRFQQNVTIKLKSIFKYRLTGFYEKEKIMTFTYEYKFKEKVHTILYTSHNIKGCPLIQPICVTSYISSGKNIVHIRGG